jgi:hypothetical protein
MSAKIRRMIQCLVIIFGVYGSPAWSAQLTLDEVLKSVDQHFPLMINARLEIQKAEADYLAAQGGFDPTLKASANNTVEGYYKNYYTDVGVDQPTALWGARVFAGWKYGQGKFPVYDSKNATFSAGEARVGVEVPILKGGSTDERRTRMGTAQRGVELAGQSAAAQRLEINKQAAFKYWDWVAAGQKLKVAEDLLQISLVRDKALIDRVKQGDTPRIDQTDNQRAVVQRRSGVISAERTLQKVSFELSLFLRDSSGVPRVVAREDLPTHFPEPKRDEALDSASLDSQWIAAHPELGRFQSQVEQNQLELRLAENQILPKLDFNFGFYSDLGSNSDGLNNLPPQNYPTEIRLGLNLEFPLFFRAPRGKREAASVNLSKLSVMKGLTQDRLQIQINDSRQAMKTALDRLELARKEISLNQVLEDAERTRFQQGESNLLIINIREQITRDAWIKEYDALADFYKSKADLLAAQGRGVQESM